MVQFVDSPPFIDKYNLTTLKGVRGPRVKTGVELKELMHETELGICSVLLTIK